MKKYSILFIIFLFALLLRLYGIDRVPPGLSNDEISIAYNAYSISKTGMDEYGKPFPIYFKSHNDYKAPLYIYLATVPIRLIGNNELAVRLPSIILGSLSVIVLGLLVFELTNNRRLTLFSALFLAIAPWHIYTSRISYESNIALFFVLLGTFLYFASFKKSKYLMVLSSISFGLSIYAYHTELVFVPMFMFVLLLIKRKYLKERVAIVVISALTFILLVSPIYFQALSLSGETTRASTEFITNDVVLRTKLEDVNNPVMRIAVVIRFWQDRYLNYFNPVFIFMSGLPLLNQFSAIKNGLLYVWMLPLLLLGMFHLKHLNKDVRYLIIAWLLLGALIPSLTLGDINIIRNLVSIVPIIILCALGVDYLSSKLKRKHVVDVTIVSLGLLSLFIFSHYYFVHFPKQLSENWSYGFKQIAEYVDENESRYDKIVIDPNYGTVRYNLVGVPHLFLLYFNEYNPTMYLSEVSDVNGILKYGKYETRKVDWPKEDIELRTLYIVGVHSTPTEGQNIKEVGTQKLLNGKVAFRYYSSE